MNIAKATPQQLRVIVPDNLGSLFLQRPPTLQLQAVQQAQLRAYP